MTALGLLKAVKFINNDFSATGPDRQQLVYVHTPKYPPPGSPEQMGGTYPNTFVRNFQEDPQFMDPAAADFRLKADSPLIDAVCAADRHGGRRSGEPANDRQGRALFL